MRFQPGDKAVYDGPTVRSISLDFSSTGYSYMYARREVTLSADNVVRVISIDHSTQTTKVNLNEDLFLVFTEDLSNV